MTARLSRRLTAVLLAATIVGAVFAAGAFASGHVDDPQDVAYLRVAHASPDAPAVDVYVDNESVLSDVEFGDVGDYLELAAGSHEVTITAAGDRDAVVFEGDVDLERGTATTVAASGEVSENGTTEFGPSVFADDALAPDDGEAAVRVAHLSPDAPTVDVTAEDGEVVLAEDVSFGDASDYVTVPDGDYTVEVREDTEDANGTVVAEFDVSLDDETAYTAWALGYVAPDEAPADEPFSLEVTEDATTDIDVPDEAVEVGAETETPTETEAPTDTETPTETESPTETETPTETEAPTETGTPTETTTETESPTETAMPTDTPTETPSDEETPTPTETPAS